MKSVCSLPRRISCNAHSELLGTQYLLPAMEKRCTSKCAIVNLIEPDPMDTVPRAEVVGIRVISDGDRARL